ncbi:hypothetical protein AVEN_216615-1 [Araneus ventricosus]|uniref:MADF domain-containing protein n=1 Tax=Araneus ventricosus TaxID=182803 RepID=A0A4Y2M4S0_ARAVE|nr:hypothetical protein AVEN_216615-1 [Araneus ventricosus]
MACKFDVTVLCELVEARPCLWDKRSTNYKNKMVRERSWEEIFTFLDDEYDAKTSSEKKETGEKIMDKHQRCLYKKSEIKEWPSRGKKKTIFIMNTFNFC